MASNIYIGTEDDGNGRRIALYGDRPGPFRANISNRVQSTQEPQTPARNTAPAAPRSLRSAAFADGGSEPQLVRDMRARNRERVLLQGLPQRTSDYARRISLRNAQVGRDTGGTLTRTGGRYGRWSTSPAQEPAAVAALRGQYAGEDAAYAKSYADITGRRDTAAENAASQQNARILESLRGENELARQAQADAGALERQDLQGQDAYARQLLSIEPQLLEAEARYGAGNLADRAAAVAERRAETNAARQAILNEQVTEALDEARRTRAQASLAEDIAQYTNNPDVQGAVRAALTPEEERLPRDQRRAAIAEHVLQQGGATVRRRGPLDAIPLLNLLGAGFADPGELEGAQYQGRLEGTEGILHSLNPFSPYGYGDQKYTDPGTGQEYILDPDYITNDYLRAFARKRQNR